MKGERGKQDNLTHAAMDRISFVGFSCLNIGRRAVGHHLSVRAALDAALVVHSAGHPVELGVLVAQHLVGFIGANKRPRFRCNATFRLHFPLVIVVVVLNCTNQSK